MTKIFISYAHADGVFASELRIQLQTAGFEVWRDIDNLVGGRDWKDQLREALREVDAVLVLLTPTSVASPAVTWEWESAQVLNKRVVPLLVIPCDIPAELHRLQYRNLSSPQNYLLPLLALVADLYSIKKPSAESTEQAAPSRPVNQGTTTFNLSGMTVNGTFQAIAEGGRGAGRDYYQNFNQHITQAEQDIKEKVAELEVKLPEVVPENREAAREALANVSTVAREIQNGNVSSENEGRFKHWLKVLAATAPELANIAVTTFMNPPAGVTMALGLIAKKAQDELAAENANGGGAA